MAVAIAPYNYCATYIKDPRICYLSLARNFGHQIAVTAGLNFVRGQVIVILDADLQEPELIPDMIERVATGLSSCIRPARRQEEDGSRFTAYGFYRLLKHLADVDIPPILVISVF